MKRILLIGLSLVVALFLLGSLALWIVLSSWVPTQGKANVIAEVERQLPVTVSIGTMRYELIKGLVLQEVQVADRGSGQLWLSTPAIRVQVGWLRLLLHRRLVFHAQSLLEVPCQTTLTLAGRYDLRAKSLSLDGHTTDIPLTTISTVLSPYRPSPLKDGALRLTLHLRREPDALPIVAGRITGTNLVWQTPAWQLHGDLMLDGTATPPAQPAGRWTFDALATMHRAALDGLPIIGTITQLEGQGRITQDQVTLGEVTGVILGSPWKLEGRVALEPHPAVEALITSRPALAPIAAALPALHELWQPGGNADVRAVCRGPLQPSPLLDCLIHSDVQNVTLAGTALTQPITRIGGSFDYDLLAHRLLVHSVAGRLNDKPVSVDGEVLTSFPLRLALDLIGTVPLDMTKPWLPAAMPVSQLGGSAVVNLQLNGPVTALHPTGSVGLEAATIHLTTPSLQLDQVTGSVLLKGNAVEVPRLSLILNTQPLTLTAHVDLQESPRIVGTVWFSTGQLELIGRVTPTDVVIDQSRLQLDQSRVQLTGRISRNSASPSALKMMGAVELSELESIPFLSLPALQGWNLHGLAEVETQFQGSFVRWREADFNGRLRADRLQVKDLPVEQLSCQFEQTEGTLRVRVPMALVAEGKFVGELNVKHHPAAQDYLLQADLVGLQLARLTQIVPAWRSRSLSGIASAHALLSGTWQDRRTWRGEGWLNASGEGLGDMPLLDKLFGGLFGVLADRMGLDMLRRAQITQASVQWQLTQERLKTDNLRLGGLAGTEPVAVYAKGSVGLDQTLDFVIEPELSESLVLQSPTTSTLASTVLKAAGQLERLRRLIGRHRLTGTLNNPQYRFELSTQEILKQLAPGPIEFLQHLLDSAR